MQADIAIKTAAELSPFALFMQADIVVKAVMFGLLLASAVTGLLPPEYPIKADARVWLFALATTVFLALVVGLPPALRAMHLKIVDALAGR